MSTNHNITVRGVQYTIKASLLENEIEKTENEVTKTLVLSDIYIGLPKIVRDVNGNRTSHSTPGNLKVSYREETRFHGEYIARNKPDIFSNDTDYSKFYNIQPDELTGSTIHKAGLNAIGKEAVGLQDDDVYFFNPLKDFETIQPVIYDIDVQNGEEVYIDIIDEPLKGGLLMYSLDGFETVQPLTSDAIYLSEGVYNIGIFNSEDGLPFMKTFTVAKEVEAID